MLYLLYLLYLLYSLRSLYLPHEPGKMVSPDSRQRGTPPDGPPDGRTHRQTDPPEWPGVCSTSLGLGLGLGSGSGLGLS